MNEDTKQTMEDESQLPTKGERKKLRREEKQREQERVIKIKARRRLVMLGLWWGLPGLVIAGVAWAVITSPRSANDDIVSRDSIHWHPRLTIAINGESKEIPGNIGIGGVHKDIHTHGTDNTLHVEMNRLVREDDVRVKNFFDIWGEQFTSECILDACNGDDGEVKMLVNGVENQEFENYLMRDGDRIEIVFEKEREDV